MILLLTEALTDPESPSGFLASDPYGIIQQVFTMTPAWLWIVTAVIAIPLVIGLLFSPSSELFAVACFAAALPLFYAAMFGDSWDKVTATALTEHYGVEITESELQAGRVSEKVLADEPSYIRLISTPPAGEERVTRDEETGHFSISNIKNPSLNTDSLTLFIDGNVLELMVKDGDVYVPYVVGSHS